MTAPPPGAGRRRRTAGTPDDPALIGPPAEAQEKKVVDVVAALDEFLAGAELVGVDRVRGELARRLALAAETAPDYSLARLAAVMDDLLSAIGTDADNERSVRAASRMLKELIA